MAAPPPVDELPWVHWGVEAPVGWYAKLDDPDGRAVARWKRRTGGGPWQAWVYPDGAVSRAVRTERGVTEDRRYDPSGSLDVLVRRNKDGPLTARVVFPALELDISAWKPVELAGATGLLPEAPTDRAGWVGAPLAGSRFEARAAPAVDAGSAAFVGSLRDQCACEVTDHVVVDVGGRPGARFRLLARLPEPVPLRSSAPRAEPHPGSAPQAEPLRSSAPQAEPSAPGAAEAAAGGFATVDAYADLWVVPLGDGSWFARYGASSLEGLAPGLAAAALVEWPPEPPEPK